MGDQAFDGIRQKAFLDRYAMKDKAGMLIENTPEEMWRRIARGVAQNEKTVKLKKYWENEFYRIMQDFKFVPGGRILAGAGTGYKVTYYNCFVIPSPQDSRDGILDTLKQMVEIMARGGGVGINLSSLRPRGTRVAKVNGFSSGPCNWAELFSVATKDIIQQGGTRRGALMLMLWDWHPDIEEFITVKQDLTRINGANLSVCVSDSFMEAVKADRDWNLYFPDNKDPDYDKKWDGIMDHWLALGKKPKLYKTVKARKLWDLISDAAWKSAEPGVVFMERYNKWHSNSYFNYINCVNPCVTGDTLVATEFGWVKAKDLTVGTKILTPKGLKPIDKVYNNGKQKIYEVCFSDGGNLNATADHKLKVVRGKKFEWVKVNDLKKGDQVVVIDKAIVSQQKQSLPQVALQYASKNNLFVNEEYDRELGFLMGVTIGDGYFGKKGEIFGCRMKLCFGLQEKEWGKILVQKLQKYGTEPKVITVEHQVPYTNGSIGTHGSKQISLYRLANVLGLAGLIPKTGSHKEIPSALFNLGEDFQKGLLDGLFSTDGSVSMKTYDPMLRLSSSSKSLLEQVRLLLLNFGIHSRIYKSKRRHTTYDGRDMIGTGIKYDLLIMNEGIAKFYELIGLTHPDKSKRLETVAQQYYFMGGTNLARVTSVTDTGREEEVFDVHEPETLTWVTNGYVSFDCGEEGLPAWGVCNLSSINLAALVNESGEMDYSELAKIAKASVRFQDNIIDQDVYVFDGIRKTQLEGERRIGLGTMGLGDALIKMKLRYGSEECLPVIEKIYKTIRNSAFTASVEIAREKGPFPKFDAKKYPQGYFIKQLPQNLKDDIRKYGVRNSVLLMQAPTGTTSLLAGTTSGIEPVYEFEFIRKSRLGQHILRHPLYETWYQEFKTREGRDPQISDRPSYFVSANDLTPEDHVKVQAAIQKYVDASISKTVNAPNAHTVADVKKLYMLAYELGCKGVTYMREGSRAGVLERLPVSPNRGEPDKKVTLQSHPGTSPAEGIPVSNGHAPQPSVPQPEIKPRPLVVHGSTYKMETPVGKAYITVNSNGEGRENPFEVFVTVGKAGSDVQAMADGLGRLISLILRMASPLSEKERVQKVIHQLSGIGGSRHVGFGERRVRSLPDAIGKVLSEHLKSSSQMQTQTVSESNGHLTPNGHTNGELKNVPHSTDTPQVASPGQQPLFAQNRKEFDLCPTCGEALLAHEEGCKKCYGCGYSEC